MKKYLILFLPFLLTGCFGLNGSGDLETTCTKQVEDNIYIKENDTYKLEYNQGDINKIILTKTYEGEVSGLNTYKKAYENEPGVDVSITDNSITYTFDMLEVSDEIKSLFELKDIYNDQIKLLKSKNYSCD